MSVREGDPLLVDATVVRRFDDVGALDAWCGYFGRENLHLVTDVEGELRRHAAQGSALEQLLESWPGENLHRLDEALQEVVAAVLLARRVDGDHPDSDRGEVATVYYADERRKGGEVFRIATDDSFGKALTRDRKLGLLNTPEIVVAMVCEDALDFKLGQRIWQACFANREKWKAYRQRIEDECAGKLS